MTADCGGHACTLVPRKSSVYTRAFFAREAVGLVIEQPARVGQMDFYASLERFLKGTQKTY